MTLPDRWNQGARASSLLLLALVPLLLAAAPASVGSAAQTSDASLERRTVWVEQTLASLTLDQKLGQMILPRASGRFYSRNDPELRQLLEAARRGTIGGAVVFAGPPRETRWLTDQLRAASPLAPLIASDYEYGVAMRVEGATRFPSAMAVAANGARAEAAVDALASITAREARALGVDLVLAPVIDLAVDPASTVINWRSFGDDPERVGQLGARFVQRLQQAGLLATVKHFPGHGATAIDSHAGLPVVNLSLDRLEAAEFVPFRAAIAAGVAGVMPGHLSVPSLDATGTPASRSKPILETLLRGELAFDGLIVSDALEMTGARTTGWDGSNVVATVAAGVDLLLVPPRPEVALQALRRAVADGELTRERIDASARRILHAKAWLAAASAQTASIKTMLNGQTGPGERLEENLSSLDAQVAARKIAENSLTLLSNPLRSSLATEGDTVLPVLPLASFEPPDVVLLVLDGDRTSGSRTVPHLQRSLRRRARSLRTLVLTPDTMSSRLPRLEGLFEQVRAASPSEEQRSPVVLLAYVSHHESSSFSDVEDFLFDNHDGPVVALSLGDPWNLVELDSTSNDSSSDDSVATRSRADWATLAAYDPSEATQRAVAAALFGESGIGGQLPVALSPEWQRGAGVALEAQVGRLAPETRSLPRAEAVLNQAIADRTTPGAVVLVGQGQQLLFEAAYGRESYDDGAAAVTVDTRFDLASLTKVIVTTTLVMHHVETGALSLDSPAALFVPEFVSEDVADADLKATITVRDLLTHASGMLWWTDLWARHGVTPSPRPVATPAIRQAKQAYLKEIVQLPLEDLPGARTVYSDLGILLLGEILERVGGKTLDQQAQLYIFEPLGMEVTGYRSRLDAPSFDIRGVAPTELDPQWRGRVMPGPVHGLVHDENAYGLGGVAAHAGLFSTARDLGRFARMLLSGGVLDGQRLLNGDTIGRFTRPALRVEGSSRALGWDTPSGERSSAGSYFSARSFGHTGFTGTSMWMDPERDLFVVLLTNRVHPTRDNQQIRALRTALHDAIVLDLEGETAVRREITTLLEDL